MLGLPRSDAAVGAALAVLLLAMPARAERIAGTRVSLEPPAGFEAASQFPGFQRTEIGASILVNEVQGPVAELRQGLAREPLALAGITLVDSSEVRVNEREALLLRVSQSAGGGRFEKWMLVFGEGERSVLVLATYPESSAPELREPLRQAVLSTRWQPTAEVDPLEGLDFRFEISGDLVLANRMANLVMLTENGAPGAVAPGDPLLLLGASIAESDLSNVEAFARLRLGQTAQIRDLDRIEGSAATLDGLPAYELTAHAVDEASGEPLRIYQLVLAHGGRYLLAQGFVGPARADTYLPQFRTISRTLRLAR